MRQVAVTAQQLAAELRAFDGRRKVVQALRRGLVRATKPAVAAVRGYATEILPAGGGLGAWVAALRISPRISYGSRSAGVRLRGSRKSAKQRSDLVRIDAGRVRHPTWGRRANNAWHSQAVTPGFWSTPLEADAQWRDPVDAEVDKALDEIRRG